LVESGCHPQNVARAVAAESCLDVIDCLSEYPDLALAGLFRARARSLRLEQAPDFVDLRRLADFGPGDRRPLAGDRLDEALCL
jgi:hypothetical protein